MADALDLAIAHGRRFVAGQSSRSVAPTGARADMLAPLPTALPASGLDPATVIDLLAEAAEPGLMGNLSGRFFAWVKGGALPAAHAADVLATLWDQNAVLAATSPAGAVLEGAACFDELVDLDGGFDAWAAAGLPAAK
jgi:glutamate/tyrosine decarboxylase-like PLP-dependent enzyme